MSALLVKAKLIFKACESALEEIEENHEKENVILDDYINYVGRHEKTFFGRDKSRIINREQANEEISKASGFDDLVKLTYKDRLKKVAEEKRLQKERIEELMLSAEFLKDQRNMFKDSSSEILLHIEDFMLIRKELTELLSAVSPLNEEV